ncbi:hypothetical protein D3C81_2274000 [compost metagenome]
MLHGNKPGRQIAEKRVSGSPFPQAGDGSPGQPGEGKYSSRVYGGGDYQRCRKLDQALQPRIYHVGKGPQ